MTMRCPFRYAQCQEDCALALVSEVCGKEYRSCALAVLAQVEAEFLERDCGGAWKYGVRTEANHGS